MLPGILEWAIVDYTHYKTEGGGAHGPSQEVGRAHLHFQAYS